MSLHNPTVDLRRHCLADDGLPILEPTMLDEYVEAEA
jgi:hypothetical protein